MKQTTQAAGIHIPASVKAGKVLSWRSVAQVLTVLSMGLLECEKEEDVKGYLKVLILLITVFLMAGLEKGGLS